jgi:hypothetical protein
LEVWESVRRCKGISCVRETSAGRGGLPVKDGVIKVLPIGERISEVMEEGGEEGGSSIFLLFSSAMIISLLHQGYQFLI